MKTVSDAIFNDGDWAFAESNRPWASWPADTPEGKMMLNYYERYKVSLQKLNEEGIECHSTLAFKAFQALTDFLEDAMNDCIPKYSILVADDGDGWIDCGEGTFITLESARSFAEAEIGKCWAIVQGSKPIELGSMWTKGEKK